MRKPNPLNSRRASPVSRVNSRFARGDVTTTAPSAKRPTVQFKWADAVSDEEWAVYRRAMEALRSANLPFLLGGGFALASFTGRWRDTKDIDFYIYPQDRPRAIAALTRAGFEDYFGRLPYDRKWIYRSTRSGVIVDIIWSMANQRAQVDQEWFARAQTRQVRGETLQVVPPEELMWCKLYIMQRDHCDWTDVFNLLYRAGPSLDWAHLVGRLEEDTLLLAGLLTVYAWLCPKHASKLPQELWPMLDLRPPKSTVAPPSRDHIRLLDSRAWFAALQPVDRKLEV